MIAASKMRRAQEMALQGRPYADNMRNLLAHLAAQPAPDDQEFIHPLLRRREIKKIEIVVVTPDRGLTGGLHSRINRVVAEFILQQKNEGIETSIVAVGRKGRDFLTRSGQDVKAVFSDIGDRPELEDVRPVATIVNDDYTAERVDAVYLAYADYVSTVTQRPVVQPLLPVVPAKLDDKDMVGYIYEPDPLTVMAALLPRFVDMQVYHSILESVASEQSARMVAMRNATDSANEMIDDLTLVMNKARQESITSELLDIVSGAAAVEA
jgi:F-type H+-transporting ATPase subunit gamma